MPFSKICFNFFHRYQDWMFPCGLGLAITATLNAKKFHSHEDPMLIMNLCMELVLKKFIEAWFSLSF